MAEPTDSTKPNFRMEHYQKESEVVVTLFIKKLNQSDVKVDFKSDSFNFSAKLPDGNNYQQEVKLSREIVPDQSSFAVLSTKVEIKLRKKDASQWTTLEKQLESEPDQGNLPKYPSSSTKKIDWDKVERNIKKEEEEEPDSDVNNLFSKIYNSGDDNTKKAMMKSMMESNGTVLSTNWDEVGKKPVEMSPPDGMEFKKWM